MNETYWYIAYHVQRIVGHWTLDMLATALMGAAALRLRRRKLHVFLEAVPSRERKPRRVDRPDTVAAPDHAGGAAETAEREDPEAVRVADAPGADA